jgi:replication factor C subunit 3/5
MENNKIEINVKKNPLLPWSEKYRPTSISAVLYHDKIIKSIVNFMSNGKLPHLLFYGQPGSGKCLGYGTPLIKYDGSIVQVQNVKVGDLLMGDDNTCRNVLSVCTGTDTMYKITQDLGDDYIVNSSHILSLKLSKTFSLEKTDFDYVLTWFQNHNICVKSFDNFADGEKFMDLLSQTQPINRAGDVCDIPIKEYIKKEEMWKKLYLGYKCKKITCWKSKNVDVDPFTLGCCYGLENMLTDELKNKRISSDYKYNDLKTRINFLQGYLSSKVKSKSDYYYFVESDLKFFEDIVFIIRSLGISLKIIKTNNQYMGLIKNSVYKYLSNCVDSSNFDLSNWDDTLEYNIQIEELKQDNYYGFELDGNKRFLLGDFTVTHNTSLILAIAKHYYKDDFDNMTMVLNASEERGIETVRNRIKQFVISKGLTEDPTVPPFKLIILDEIDAMTDDAQAILRKVIEKYVNNVRFCFICNYLKKINPAIQSRCVIFRFNPIPKKEMHSYIERVCENEKIFITRNAMELITKRSNGDMRKLLNILQSLYMHNNMNIEINEENLSQSSKKMLSSPTNKKLIICENSVSKILSCPTKKNIIDILNCLQTCDMKTSHITIQKIINKNGISLLELINNIYEFAMDYLITGNTEYIKYPKEKVINIIKKLAAINENLTYCNTENIQLVSFVAIFYI